MLHHYIPAYKEAQFNQVQSTLVVSKSKEPSETLRDIRTSTYQVCRIKENTKSNNQISKIEHVI